MEIMHYLDGKTARNNWHIIQKYTTHPLDVLRVLGFPDVCYVIEEDAITDIQHALVIAARNNIKLEQVDIELFQLMKTTGEI